MTTIYTFQGQVLTEASTGKWLTERESPVDPFNPLNLPPNTVRIRTNGEPSGNYDSATLVPGTSDVYDIYKSGTNFFALLAGCDFLVEILGANTTGITDMSYMFHGCGDLTRIPLFDTLSVTDMSFMFNDCWSVESGALAFYQQASSQATPPSAHEGTFYNCGSDTVTGAAELAQIPSDWK